LKIRRLLFDVDKALARPSILEIATAVDACSGVEAFHISVEDVDTETMDLNVSVEGENLNHAEIVAAIEKTGAVVHGLEQISAGIRTIEPMTRSR
jgi:hypothetical protein